MIINKKIFNKSVSEFDAKESRTSFFAIARKLIDAGFEIEGMLLILTTWNFAVFRYVTKTFEIKNLIKALAKIKPLFDKLNDQDFETIDFDTYKKEISTIYSVLSQIKGIEYTGAPKLMHLKNPKLFVMWDAYIRGDKPQKKYKQLECYENGYFQFKKYPNNSEGYIDFLKDMQLKFKNIKFKGDKTFAKAIDEFNYVNVTIPMQILEKQRKNKPV